MHQHIVVRLLTALSLSMAAALLQAAPTGSDPQHVLVLFSGQRDSPAERAIEAGLRSTLTDERSDSPVRLSVFYLDMFERYDVSAASVDRQRLATRLRTLPPVDMVVSVAAPAARFLGDHRDLFPEGAQAAMLGAYAGSERLEGPGTRTFRVTTAVARTLEHGLRLFPDTRRVMVIAGSGIQDKHDLRVARTQLAALQRSGVAPDIEWLTDFTRAGLLQRVTTLEAGTLLLMTVATEDVDGKPLLPPSRFADELARAASVPMLCVYEGMLRQSGCLGGVVTAGRVTGEALARSVLAMLAGSPPPDAVTDLPGRPMFRGDVLARWNIAEEALPAQWQIIESRPSLYQRYKGLIWTGIVLIFAQAMSILALVVALRNSRRHRHRIRDLQQRWAFALESAGHGVWDWDIAADHHFFSRGWSNLLGLPRGRGRAATRDALIHPMDLPEAQARLTEALEGDEGSYQSEHRTRHADGRVLWVLERGRVVERDDDNRPTRLVATLEDITERREAAEQVKYMATHDALTGLPNRTLLADRIERAISRARREGGQMAVIFMDLDHFKQINDTLGHHIGDTLLVAVAGRMMPHLREADTISRQGGDEFVILLPELHSAEDAARVCEKLLAELEQPIQFEGHELHTSASMGVALYPDDGHNMDMLLQKADVALYRVKDSGRRSYRFFSAEMNTALNDCIDLEKRITGALNDGLLQLWYQPQFDLRSGKLCGAEALMRWIEPDGTIIPPNRFIPVAEQFGHIHALGAMALRSACAEARRWQLEFGVDVPVAVNLSAAQFRRVGLSEMVAELLDEQGLPPQLLVLEITESVVMEDESLTRDTLQALAATGALLAIDDFGTGYSSLAYLKRFPVHHLKIDRAFVKDLGRDPDDEVIVRTIVQLGHSLGLVLVAEGVETEAQARILRSHGCECVQGFLYGRPQDAVSFRKLLQEQSAMAS